MKRMRIWSLKTLFFTFGKRLLCSRVCLGTPYLHQAQLASQSPIGFVKAGIGGFHTAGKQLAGKACNGVIS